MAEIVSPEPEKDNAGRVSERMSEENGRKGNKVTSITRKGPMNAQERKEAKALFVASLCKDPNVSLACDEAKISRKTAYQWRDDDEEFAKDWDSSIERAKDIVRSAIFQRAAYGWKEIALSMNRVVYYYTPVIDPDTGEQKYDDKGRPIMQRGDVVYIHKWDTALQLGWAKANLPEYKDKQSDINIYNEINALAANAKNELLASLAPPPTKDESQDESQS